jgi:hypothetical protein
MDEIWIRHFIQKKNTLQALTSFHATIAAAKVTESLFYSDF